MTEELLYQETARALTLYVPTNTVYNILRKTDRAGGQTYKCIIMGRRASVLFSQQLTTLRKSASIQETVPHHPTESIDISKLFHSVTAE